MPAMSVCIESSRQGSRNTVQYVIIAGRDPRQLFSLAILLQRFAYHICTARSGTETMDITKVAIPSLVITELDLEGMSGLDLLRALRSGDTTASVPVIALARDRDPETRQRCLRGGFAACLTMPVAPDELYRAVQFALEPTPRTNIRVPIRIPVTVNGELLDCGGGECASVLSEHGMYIRTLRPAAVNDQLSLSLQVKDRAVAAEAVVLYSHGLGEGPYGEPGMGMKFTRIDERDQKHIRQFILEEITRGIAKP